MTLSLLQRAAPLPSVAKERVAVRQLSCGCQTLLRWLTASATYLRADRTRRHGIRFDSGLPILQGSGPGRARFRDLSRRELQPGRVSETWMRLSADARYAKTVHYAQRFAIVRAHCQRRVVPGRGSRSQSFGLNGNWRLASQTWRHIYRRAP